MKNVKLKKPQFLLIVLAIAVSSGAQSSNKPNVVFILADNVGYGDMGTYGGGELRGMPTLRTDQMAKEGLRFTQFLVEAACTPSRAALMTGQYSIRSGLSLIIMGATGGLPADQFTMGEMFKNAGYATAIFGKWHLGAGPQSLPTAHGFDEFYGIPPDISWDACNYATTISLTKTVKAPLEILEAKGPQIVESTAGGQLHNVKPFTPEVRANIDNELVEKSIDFMKRQKATGKPFFLYLPFSMGHAPSYPSAEFKGKSGIGNYGDKIMEGDYHVGQILDELKSLGIDDNTLVIFASDNGPWGDEVKDLGNLGTPDMGNPGPFRGELGEATEGSIRTFCFARWPGHIQAGTTSSAMFSIMDFLPTFASIINIKLPADKPFDGIDQTDVLLGKSKEGHREDLLTFIGPDLVAARVGQWRVYFTDIHPTGAGHELMGGLASANGNLNGYPHIYNIQMDPHEDLDLMGKFPWVSEPALKAVMEYKVSLKKYPNPLGANLTHF
jgi:arylsulfatase A-like enzyme